MRKSKSKLRAEELIHKTNFMPHWHNSKLFCPHCKHTFEYREMWMRLGEQGLTIWEVAALLGVTWQTVVAAVRTHRMGLAIKGTKHRNAIEELALRAGFNSAKEMLYQLRVKDRLSYEGIGRFLDMTATDVQEACKLVLLGEEGNRYGRS